MNERILELAEQAGASVSTIGGIFINKTNLDIEKFAELIVRECAKFLDENSGYDDSNNAWHPEPEDMLKHFGVK
jgi:hypothetical protein